ncbi:MAG: helix-turn-helix transcriptional regulator [Bacillus sp. (in: firmicutes)]
MSKQRIWLRDIRKTAGYKQYELASVVGISPGYYSTIENGERKTPGDLALKISLILDFPLEWFYLDDIQEWIDENRDLILKEVKPNA